MVSNYNIDEHIIAFDIGGTWFRSGVVSSNGKLISMSRSPAINFKNHPKLQIDELQNAFIEYLINESARLSKKYLKSSNYVVTISMGAALNGYTGFIYNSGPLWGPNSKSLDLIAILKKGNPEVKWIVIKIKQLLFCKF